MSRTFRTILICSGVLAVQSLLANNAIGLPAGLSKELIDSAIAIKTFVLFSWVYLLPIVTFFLIYSLFQNSKYSRNNSLMQESIEAGLTEPVSLHPEFDHNICIGCEACANACPGQDGHTIIGLINKKAHLVSPTDCIGHGACKDACPVGAITLVFGTKNRGVDIPIIDDSFQTEVPGIYIAGELGGVGLIRNAIEQGRKAINSIAQNNRSDNKDLLDVLIVGAGPAGFSASLAALEQGLNFVTVERGDLGGTVSNFPKNKTVMTSPVNLPIAGEMKFTETKKETLLNYWLDVEKKTGVTINYKEKVESIDKSGTSYDITTTSGKYKANNILLALGRRGTPRKLEVPGEDLEKVEYRLIDPAEHRGKKVLVVGGGDSALEAALSIAAEPDTEVLLSYRGEAFSRAKAKNRQKVELACKNLNFQTIMSSTVNEIKKDHVLITHNGEIHEYENDATIICAGGILPTNFLKNIGVTVETKFGTA